MDDFNIIDESIEDTMDAATGSRNIYRKNKVQINIEKVKLLNLIASYSKMRWI